MKTSLLTGSLLLTLVFVTGCKKSEEETIQNNCTTASEKAKAYSAAAQAYGSAPTKANCDKLKSTALDFIEFASGCATYNQADVKAARDQVNAVVCQ